MTSTVHPTTIAPSSSGFLHFFWTDITLRKYLYILTFHTPQVQRSMTSQVEGGSELAALQQAAELEASEQKRVAEKAMEDEANSVLKVKREKRERGRRQRKEIMDEFEEDDDEDDEDDDEEENGQATVKATDVEKAWKEILGLVESSQGKIVARNITETYEKFKALAQGGAKQLQVISDFDRTISKYYLNDGKTKGNSCHGILHNCDLPNFAEEAQKLFNKYYPMEVSAELSQGEKVKACEEWWGKNHALLMDLGLTKEKMKSGVAAGFGEIILRGGYKQWVDFLEALQVPLIIFSAGLADVIEEFLKLSSYEHKNVKILSNKMIFDEASSTLTGFDGKIIHTYNKGLIAFDNLDGIVDVGRNNILLVGDSEGDVKMADGIDTNVVFKIGYLNHNEEQLLSKYLGIYDVVIMGDPDMTFVDTVTRSICIS